MTAVLEEKDNEIKEKDKGYKAFGLLNIDLLLKFSSFYFE